METNTNQLNSQQAEQTLQLNRSLLSIDEYAAREGVSRSVVEEYKQLGIIQIRRHKDKMFVVDVPLSPYAYPSEETEEPKQHTDKAIQTKSISEPIQTPDLQTPEINDEPLEFGEPDSTEYNNMRVGIDKTRETEETAKSAQITQNHRFRLDFSNAKPTSKRTWRVTAALSLIFLCVALLASFWLYIDREIQFDRVSQAHASIQKAHSDFTRANQRAETIQNELDIARAELQHVQNELNKSNAEVKTLRDELAQAKLNLKTIQQRNAKSVEWFNNQTRKLTTRLTELTKKQ